MEEGWEQMREHLKDHIADLKDYNLIKVLGKGAYGKVSLAINKKDGKEYAIKTLFNNCMEGKQLKMFCREVQILAKCHNMFILPFKGFTLSSPYSIITNYVSNGSLYEALRRKKDGRLTPTQKTIIAMGISHGIMHMHKLNIIHRDLKSLNILLDDKMYPKVCDFGISRFEVDNDQPITQNIGTPHWMAPELFQNSVYDARVDVYAYGIILWELLTEEIPYRGLNQVQIMSAVCQNHSRPSIPYNTPEALATLIQLCWAQNPDERPSFENIFKLFAEKHVYFKGTELKEIDDFLKEIEKQENVKTSPNKVLLPEVNLDIIEQQNLDITFIKKEYKYSTFPVKIKNLLKTINKKNSEILFSELSKIIPSLSDDMMISLLSIIHDSFKRNKILISSFVGSGMITVLPYLNQNIFEQLYQIVLDSLEYSITSIPFEKIKDILNVFPNYPYEIFQIIFIYSKNVTDDFVAYFLSNFSIYYSCSPIYSLDILLQIVKKNNYIKENGIQKYKEIIKDVFKSNNIKILQIGYKLISILFFEDLIPDNIIEHMKNQALIQYILIVINLSETIKINQDLISIILDNIKYKNAILLLIKMSKTYENAKIILNLSEKWINNTDIPSSTILLIVEMISKHKEITFTEKQISNLCCLFDENLLSESSNLSIISLICHSIKLDEQIVGIFDKTGFLSNYIKSATEINSSASIHSLLVLLIDISKITLINCFEEIINQLPSLVKQLTNYEYITAKFLESLSKYPKMKEIIESSEIKTLLLNCEKSQEIKQLFSF